VKVRIVASLSCRRGRSRAESVVRIVSVRNAAQSILYSEVILGSDADAMACFEAVIQQNPSVGQLVGRSSCRTDGDGSAARTADASSKVAPCRVSSFNCVKARGKTYGILRRVSPTCASSKSTLAIMRRIRTLP
jgi:hypothetical protein